MMDNPPYKVVRSVMRCRHSKISPNDPPDIDVCEKCSRAFDIDQPIPTATRKDPA